MAYLLQHTIALLFLLAVFFLPGLLLERPLMGGARRGPLRRQTHIVLGLGFWIAATFLLASLGLLRSGSLWVVISVLGISAFAAWILAGRPIQFARPPAAAVVPLALLGALLAPFFLLAMSPPVSWDASAYHLTVPRLFVDHGGFREVPLNVYSYWPLNIQLLFALAMLIDDYVLAKLLHFAFGVATLYATAAACRAFHRPASALLAMVLVLANGVFAFELRVAYVDLAYAFLFLAGFLFMLEALDRDPRSLWLSGLCCGLLAGVKVTGIAGAAVVGALYLPRLVAAFWQPASWQREPAPVLRPFIIRFVAPVLALWVPWIVRTGALTGNPFYPFFHSQLGGPDWSSALTLRFQEWQSSIGMGREAIDYLLLPLRVILAGGRGYERFDGEIAAFWIVIIPLALWAALRLTLVRRCLAATGLYFVFWSLSSQQMRFLIPALPLLAIAGAVAVVELLDRLPKARWRRAGRALAVITSAAFLISTQGRTLAAGYRTLGVYLRAPGDLRASAVPPVFDFLNTDLPPDARLLFLNTNQTFFCDREILADSFFEASQIADWLAPARNVAELRRLLSLRGVTHVLVERRDWGIEYPAALGEMLADPAEAELVYQSEDRRFSVFELQRPATPIPPELASETSRRDDG